ncbi:MAG: hypothetical protein E7440_08295 [Ruminococcaceae bacterium]|nr:hypothetical protein [Oscillospiraceae bacterium]MBE6974387.1 hypothetical protein [Oscillospiraceae bacterium]
MFGKLMKHEWRATAPTQGLLALASLGVGILAGIILRLLFTYGEEIPEILTASMGASIVFMLLAVVICAAAMSILLMVRFYKHKFTDEGYLTFTLPVSSHQVFLSAALNNLIWLVISFLTVILSFAAFFLIGIAGVPEMDAVLEVFDYYGMIFEDILPDGGKGYTVIYLLQMIVTLPYSIVITMTCFTVGATIAKKHKILAAIGIYYALSWGSSIVSSIVSVVLSLNSADLLASSDPEAYLQYMQNTVITTGIVTLVWQLALILGGYLLSTRLMSKKLNLP